MSYKKVNIEEFKEQVIKEMSGRGIDVYIIDISQEDGDWPYCVYTFDEELVPLAKELWKENKVTKNVFDDWSMDEDHYVDDLVETMMGRYDGTYPFGDCRE